MDTQPAVISSITDTRHTPLGQLAGTVVAEALKNVLPGGTQQRVAVAAFNASL